jgi:hypothetical protein
VKLRQALVRRRRVGVLVTALTAALAPFVVAPNPAQAAPDLCVYSDAYERGASLCNHWAPDMRAHSLNDQISSIYNGSSQRMCLYRDISFTGDYLVVNSNNNIPNLDTSAYWGWNDQISSMKAC